MATISVLLIDDHTVVRQGLGLLLSAEPDITIVGEAADGMQGVELARKLKPDVVLTDLAMPVLNGLEATRAIVGEAPHVKVVVLTSYSNDEYVRQAIQAGAVGFLLKETAANDLVGAIREVHRGNAFFSPVIARRLRDQTRNAAQPDARALTARESQVLQLVADGCPNKKIAAELGISIKTVEKHRQQVMNKLGIHHTAGLTRFVLSQNTGNDLLGQRPAARMEG